MPLTLDLRSGVILLWRFCGDQLPYVFPSFSGMYAIWIDSVPNSKYFMELLYVFSNYSKVASIQVDFWCMFAC